MRFGFKILPDYFEENEYSNNYDPKKTNMNNKDIIEYLSNYCIECNVYTPKSSFHINLPKSVSLNKVEIANSNDILNIDLQKKLFEGLYWDLGWLDVKNNIFYETSIFYEIFDRPERMEYFENFIDFLQIIIDKKIWNSIFDFFGFELSVLTENDRYLPKNIFESKIISVFEETVQKNKDDSNQQKKEELNYFAQFISGIVSGFDEENNINEDHISYILLKKKITSYLQNFADCSDNDDKMKKNKGNIMVEINENIGE